MTISLVTSGAPVGPSEQVGLEEQNILKRILDGAIEKNKAKGLEPEMSTFVSAKKVKAEQGRPLKCSRNLLEMFNRAKPANGRGEEVPVSEISQQFGSLTLNGVERYLFDDGRLSERMEVFERGPGRFPLLRWPNPESRAPTGVSSSAEPNPVSVRTAEVPHAAQAPQERGEPEAEPDCFEGCTFEDVMFGESDGR